MRLSVIAGLALLLFHPHLATQNAPHPAPTTHVQVSPLPAPAAPTFDAKAATDRYLAKVAGPARAKSDAYFEGGYWLQLLDLTVSLVVAGFLLWSGLSAHISDWAQEKTRSKSLQVMLYGAVYVLGTALLTLPVAFYEGFLREHAYGFSTQTLPAWLGDFAIQIMVNLVSAMIALPILYAAVRAAGRACWIWGAVVMMVLLTLQVTVYPVFVAPLTNHYQALPESPLKHDIQSLARANGIPADNVYWFDGSRQSNKISANVSGFLGTTRLSLNDNLLNHTSRDEILIVLGHEMGHYVLGHTTRLILLGGLVIAVAFAFMYVGFYVLTGIFGGNWQVREISDVAGLPLLMALMSLFFFIATPIVNTINRTTETQADIFGINAVRKPDAAATTILKLASYRKLDPSPWEEAIFYDTPSGRTRIQTAMTWKQEHIGDADIRATANLP